MNAIPQQPLRQPTCKITLMQTTCDIAWFTYDQTLWQEIKASFKSTFPQAHYDQSKKSWVVTRSQETDVRTWAARYFPHDAMAIKDDDHQPMTPKPPLDSIKNDYAQLHLLPSAPLRVVKAAYRALSKQDTDLEQQYALDASYRRILAATQAPPKRGRVLAMTPGQVYPKEAANDDYQDGCIFGG